MPRVRKIHAPVVHGRAQPRPLLVDASLPASRQPRRRRPRKNRRSRCRAWVDAAPWPGPATADSGHCRPPESGSRRRNGFDVSRMNSRKAGADEAQHAKHSRACSVVRQANGWRKHHRQRPPGQHQGPQQQAEPSCPPQTAATLYSVPATASSNSWRRRAPKNRCSGMSQVKQRECRSATNTNCPVAAGTATADPGSVCPSCAPASGNKRLRERPGKAQGPGKVVRIPPASIDLVHDHRVLDGVSGAPAPPACRRLPVACSFRRAWPALPRLRNCPSSRIQRAVGDNALPLAEQIRAVRRCRTRRHRRSCCRSRLKLHGRAVAGSRDTLSDATRPPTRNFRSAGGSPARYLSRAVEEHACFH